MDLIKISVLDRLLRRDPLLWVELEHLVQQVQRIFVLVLDERLNMHAGLVLEVLDESECVRIFDNLHFLFVRLAQLANDLLDLLDVVLPGEQDLARE